MATSERDLHHDVLRGVHAETELRETDAAFDALIAGIVRKMLDTSPGNPELIVRLHATAFAAEGAREALKRTVVNARHAEHVLAAEQAIAETGLARP